MNVFDADGCPDTLGSGDRDSDGILDNLDACPNAKETYNQFQDTDGCPDGDSTLSGLDNDGDGIYDLNDKCPLNPETVNGFQDDRRLP